MGPAPRSLVWATDIDVLPADRIVIRRDGYLVVRSPGNPDHWWGNLLLFDAAPAAGDGERWASRFDAEFIDAGGVRHRTLAWDRPDGDEGAAADEFGARGYDLERHVGLVAAPSEITPHARANREVQVRPLSPSPGADAELWEEVIALQVAGNDAAAEPIADYERYARSRQRELRTLFAAGRGAWYAALDPGDGAVLAGCGIVVTGPRGRFQHVETAAAHRRRGICTRLVVEAVTHAGAEHDLSALVIAAAPDDHALGIYESLGFRRRERVCGACLPPGRARGPDPGQRTLA